MVRRVTDPLNLEGLAWMGLGPIQRTHPPKHRINPGAFLAARACLGSRDGGMSGSSISVLAREGERTGIS